MRRARVKVTTEVTREGNSLDVAAYCGKQRAACGRISALIMPKYVWLVRSDTEPAFRRMGVATSMYTALAQASCREAGVPLASDASRSPAAEAFWQKQVKKRRAKPYTDDVGRHRYILSCPAPKSLGGLFGRR